MLIHLRVTIMLLVALSFLNVSMINQDLAALAQVGVVAVREDYRMTEAYGPSQVAVNTQTHLVYVTNPVQQTVTVIEQENETSSDGNSTLLSVVDTIEVPHAYGIAVNPLTNMIYVSEHMESSVYVINGSTNRVAHVITVGDNPRGVAVNPSTNTVYVANFFPGSISVIDGITNTVTHTIELADGNIQAGPRGLAIDTETNRLYVANWLSDSVSIIDLSNNMVIGKVMDVGKSPSEIAVSDKTGKVYVANHNSISVIASHDNDTYGLIKQLTLEEGPPKTYYRDSGHVPGGLAISQERNLIYFTNRVSNSTAIIDGDKDNIIAANIANSSAIKTPEGIAVDEILDSIYVVGKSSNALTLIEASNHEVMSSIQIGGWPTSVALNPNTNMVYVGNYEAGTVSLLNATASNNLIDIISLEPNVLDVEFNDKTNKIYALTSTVDPDGYPRGTVAVIDGNTNSIVDRISLPASALFSMAIDTKANLLYVGHGGYGHPSTIIVIDGSTNEVAASFYTGSNNPELLAVNEEADKLYVVSSDPSMILVYNNVSKNDNATEDSEPIKIPIIGSPGDIAVISETDEVYVTDYHNSTLWIIDGSTDRVVETLAGFGNSPGGVAVNPTTNTVYVTNPPLNTLTVIDGSNNEIVAELVTDEFPVAVAVNNENGAVYVTHTGSGTILTYDQSEIDATKSRMIPFVLTAKVEQMTSTKEGQQPSQDDYAAAPKISGRAQDVNVTDVTIKPQENMIVINYTRIDNSSTDGVTGKIRGGIIEITLPTSMSQISWIGLGGSSPPPDYELVITDELIFNDDYDYFRFTNPAPPYTDTTGNLASNTTKFIVPLSEEGSIIILGANVIPEFGSFSMMIVTASIVGSIVATKYAARNRLQKKPKAQKRCAYMIDA